MSYLASLTVYNFSSKYSPREVTGQGGAIVMDPVGNNRENVRMTSLIVTILVTNNNSILAYLYTRGDAGVVKTSIIFYTYVNKLHFQKKSWPWGLVGWEGEGKQHSFWARKVGRLENSLWIMWIVLSLRSLLCVTAETYVPLWKLKSTFPIIAVDREFRGLAKRKTLWNFETEKWISNQKYSFTHRLLTQFFSSGTKNHNLINVLVHISRPYQKCKTLLTFSYY